MFRVYVNLPEGVFTNIWVILRVNARKYSMHGASGLGKWVTSTF
jgi:hypothetical protein